MELTLQIKAKSPLEFKGTKEAIENIARLDYEMLKAIENIARLDYETLMFLGELSKNQKAVEKLNSNKKMIKMMIM